MHCYANSIKLNTFYLQASQTEELEVFKFTGIGLTILAICVGP